MRWAATMLALTLVLLTAAGALEPFTRVPMRYRDRVWLTTLWFGVAGGILFAWRVGAR